MDQSDLEPIYSEPLDPARIRADWEADADIDWGWCLLALCDALEKTRAELAELRLFIDDDRPLT